MQKYFYFFKSLKKLIASISALTLILGMSGCVSSPSWLPSSGANYSQIQGNSESLNASGIYVVDVDDAMARRLLASQQQNLFSDIFKKTNHFHNTIGAGDVLEVYLWEAPPASLFGSGSLDSKIDSLTTRVTTFPEQMVSADGTINIPFAGQVPAAGYTLQQIELEIVRRLKEKANQPQALVKLTHNNTSNVTIVGEVASSTRMPLTARGERLLDALAVAGGVRQPINKMTLQLTRGDQVQALPLETIIRDPKQNIVLEPGDVITSIFQSLSFTVLGATGKNDEVNFEAQGISLTQALARAGGLQDNRADAQGVFIFRLESPDLVDVGNRAVTLTPDGKIPVIYRMNLKDPAAFFIAQSFPIRNRDVLYVSNAPGTELQKFLNIVVSVIYPVISIRNVIN